MAAASVAGARKTVILDFSSQLPPVARRRAEALGAEGLAWIRGLDTCVAGLASEWDLRPLAVLSGGTEALVVDCRTGDGEARILKLILPGRDPDAIEARVLTLAEGQGYVRLFESDPALGALLMERLGPSLGSLGLPEDQQLRAICDTLLRAWRPLDDPGGFLDGATKAADLAGFIRRLWRELGTPCSARAVERACAYAEDRARAFDPDSAVLAHGDAHAWNTLLVPDSRPETFRLIDPDGLFIERAYDLGISMREGAAELLAGDPVRRGQKRCRQLAAMTGVPEAPIWQWGFIERVSTGLLALQLKMDEATDILAVAEAWAGVDPPK